MQQAVKDNIAGKLFLLHIQININKHVVQKKTAASWFLLVIIGKAYSITILQQHKHVTKLIHVSMHMLN